MWDFLCLQDLDLEMCQDLFPSSPELINRVGSAASIEDKRKCYKGTLFLEGSGVSGCTIFYNAQKFQQVQITSRQYYQRGIGELGHICVIGKYRHLETEKVVYVATTRLPSGRIREVDRFVMAR